MKSILWILNGCGLEGKGITGAPVRFYEISRRFASHGINQHLLTTLGGKIMQTTLGCSLPMTVVPASFVLKKEPCRPFRFWSYLVTSFLWRFFKRHIPKSETIITVSDYFCDIIPALDLKKRSGAKWIAWIHHCESDPKTRPGNRLVNEITARMQKWSFKKIARYADSAWINDTIAGDEIERRLLLAGMPPERIRRMKNGINVSDIGNIPEPDEKSDDAVMIGARPNKGLFDIIPIWKRVCEMRPNTTLVVMGGMSGESEVVDEVEKLNLPIKFFKPVNGFLSGKDYYAKIKKSRILFAPSHEEGWGIAVCEAMALGLPVVAYDLPAYQKIYGDSYRAIECFDYEMFSRAIIEVLENPSISSELKAKGLSAAVKYDWDKIAEEDRNCIEQIWQ